MFFENDYIDLHCHPSLKPFGKSFNYKPIGVNSSHRSSKRSIWYYNPPSLIDKALNYVTGLTKFSQSNFTALTYGGVGIVCVSLYPLEKSFVRNNITNELIADLASNFALGIGDKRIDFIQGIQDYYADLVKQYKFYVQLDGVVKRLPEGRFRYKLVNSYEEIEQIRLKEKKGTTNIRTICVVLSIEGLHVLNTDLKSTPNENEFLNNLDAIKQWKFRPFFITIAHHFWNHICGHATSLTGVITKFADQSEGLNQGFTELGKKVLAKLVDNTNGTRILPDIKHMSPAARNEYYALLDSNKAAYDGIPLIISHGACNGLFSYTNPVPSNATTSKKMNPVTINFYDDEIIRLAKSGGIVGLQLDERRIASKGTLKKTKHSLFRNKIMHYRSELLWNQIQHIAELLDRNDLFAWNCMAIGSDFDGIIDSLNGFWTSEELPYLADFLERHAYNYLQTAVINNEYNKIGADEVVIRVMSKNAHNFMKKYFQ